MRIPTICLSAICAAAIAACGGSSASSGDANTAAAESHPLIGNPAPAFTLDSVNGKGKVSISGMNGKVVVVDFWATWCAPCKKSFPKLQELNVKYKASGVHVVGVSEDDDKAGITGFASTYGADFPLTWDKDNAVAGKWNPGSMPATFVIDRRGVVRFIHRGYHDGEEMEIEKEVKSLL